MCNGDKKPLVSVIVCVYNAGGYLRASVESLLAQTHRNLEILIVDDGSTDGCMAHIDHLQDPRIRLIRQTNAGKPVAMNVGLGQMTGDFYAVHDADDLSHPRRIELQLACLQANPDVAAVYCGHELILNDQRIAPTGRAKDRAACRRDIDQFRMPGHDPTGMYRWSLVKDERYDADLPIVEGFDYILRLGERHPMLALEECLYTYRIHVQSVTKRNPEKRERLVHEVLRRACARRGMDFNLQFPTLSKPHTKRNRDFDNNIAANFMDSVCDLRRWGRRSDAIATGLFCSRLHPLDPHYHKALIYSVVPNWLLRRIRKAGN